MITMAFVPLLGAGLIALAALFIHHRAAVQKRSAGVALDEAVQDKLKQGQAKSYQFAQTLLAGGDIDAAIEDLTTALSSIHALKTDKSWLWDSDHLLKWAKEQLALRVAAINQRARLTVFATLVCIVLAVVAIDAVIYGQLTAVNSVLSPYPPSKSAPVSHPVPSSSPAPVSAAP